MMVLDPSTIKNEQYREAVVRAMARGYQFVPTGSFITLHDTPRGYYDERHPAVKIIGPDGDTVPNGWGHDSGSLTDALRAVGEWRR